MQNNGAAALWARAKKLAEIAKVGEKNYARSFLSAAGKISTNNYNNHVQALIDGKLTPRDPKIQKVINEYSSSFRKGEYDHVVARARHQHHKNKNLTTVPKMKTQNAKHHSNRNQDDHPVTLDTLRKVTELCNKIGGIEETRVAIDFLEEIANQTYQTH